MKRGVARLFINATISQDPDVDGSDCFGLAWAGSGEIERAAARVARKATSRDES